MSSPKTSAILARWLSNQRFILALWFSEAKKFRANYGIPGDHEIQFGFLAFEEKMPYPEQGQSDTQESLQ